MKRLKSSYDERFYQQEVLGSYLNLHSGRVYFAFDRKKHLKATEVSARHPLLWALDFNVNPMSSVIAQVINGLVYVHDEIVLNRASTFDACAEFAHRFPAHAAGLEIYGDASGARQQTAGNTDYAIVEECMRRSCYQFEMKVPRSNPAGARSGVDREFYVRERGGRAEACS